MPNAAIYIDTRQQDGKHAHKDDWFAAHKYNIVRRKLDFGDYMADGSNVSVDTKRNVAEIAQNIGGKNHARFKRECIRAREAGYRLVILVENLDGYTQLSHVAAWTNTHCRHCALMRQRICDPRANGKCLKHKTLKPIQGPRLMKAMQTMEKRYGVKFEFCKPKNAAKRICELLGVLDE